MKKKSIALLMAVVMLFGATVGGTIAWLTAKTDEVKNTFTVGNIDILLDETDYDNSTPDKDRDTANEYKMLPGNSYVKDPIVHVEAGSEPCYVFVKLVETANTFTVNGTTEKVIEYKINDGWVLVDAAEKIYMYGTNATTATIVNALEATDYVDTTSILKGTTVDGVTTHITINSKLPKSVLDAMEAETNPTPTPVLTFTACAVQSANVLVTEAIDQAIALL